MPFGSSVMGEAPANTQMAMKLSTATALDLSAASMCSRDAISGTDQGQLIIHATPKQLLAPLNTTSCNDGTICPKNNFSTSPNITCCASHQGKTETQFNNPAVMPTSVADLSSYYAAGNYTIVSDGHYRTAARASAVITSSPIASVINGTTAGVPTATSSNGPSSSSPTSGLSTGAKIGIAVAVTAVGILVVILLGCIYCLRRRRKHNNSQDMPSAVKISPPHENNVIPKSELPVDPSAMEVDAGEEQQVPTEFEMSGYDARTELDAKELPELPCRV
ncbi:MAG: hypothetical protein Q9220_003453 [cf. Caloplaca sp. 1 TL-2023]